MDNMKNLKEIFVLLNSVFLMLLLVSIPICMVVGSTLFITITSILALVCNAIIVGLMVAEIIIKRMK